MKLDQIFETIKYEEITTEYGVKVSKALKAYTTVEAESGKVLFREYIVNQKIGDDNIFYKSYKQLKRASDMYDCIL